MAPVAWAGGRVGTHPEGGAGIPISQPHLTIPGTATEEGSVSHPKSDLLSTNP